jgi:hypothetical protein
MHGLFYETEYRKQISDLTARRNEKYAPGKIEITGWPGKRRRA